MEEQHVVGPGEDAARERAQLVSLYFNLRSLRNPPPYLASVEERLRRELAEPLEASADLPARGHLRRVR